ncbi:MAG: hypothetical protein J3Q66DRAFT_332817 [Benniella sp.]|nr:MAG: hypothetical protein J3Q66DRAFT_332817 [Benniella sp.]
MSRLSDENAGDTSHAMATELVRPPCPPSSILGKDSIYVPSYTTSSSNTDAADSEGLHMAQSNTMPQPRLASEDANSEHSLLDRKRLLETELSELQSQLQQSEESLASREKSLKQAHQQCFHTQQSLQTLKQQYEITLIQLTTSQADTTLWKTQLTDQDNEIQDLKNRVRDLSQELKEVTMDRDSLSFEMTDCHADNAKFLKRLRAANVTVDGLQEENRHLIEQLRGLRAKTVEISDEKRRLQETLDRERHLAGQAALDLEKVVMRYKGEVERLQDIVLAMGHKHVQAQGQLEFLQQRARAHWQPLTIEHGDNSRDSRQPMEQSQAPVNHASLSEHNASALSDGALKSILSSVAESSHTQRSKPTRRFTVNASHPTMPLTPEQRKYDLLMDHIMVLQRGYDTLREEKVSLESQLDSVQRELQFHYQGMRGTQEKEVKDQLTQSHEKQGSNAKGLGLTQKPSSPHQQQPTSGPSSPVWSPSSSISLSSSSISSASSFSTSPIRKGSFARQPPHSTSAKHNIHFRHRPPKIVERANDRDVQQCSCCMGELIEI